MVVEFRTSVDIATPSEVVWAVMSDVERWHEWTPSVRSIRLVGGGPIEVFGLADVVAAVRAAARSKTYRDNPVLVTMKVLESAGLLTGDLDNATVDPV